MDYFSSEIDGSITIDTNNCKAFEKLFAPIIGESFSLTSSKTKITGKSKYTFGGELDEDMICCWSSDIEEQLPYFAISEGYVEIVDFCNGEDEEVINYKIIPMKRVPSEREIADLKAAEARLKMFFEI